MKIKFTILIFFFIQLLFSQNYHDTQGKLDVSSGGQAVYTIPIALPPSINSTGPTINLTYASGQMGGIVGQGWNISSISTIARMSTRKDVDGFVDGVDFDDNDKLAFEGQRLILKSGTYWADGSVYETEVQSNTKIQLFGSGTNIYFIVTAPDGSRSWYGNYSGNNATELSVFYIVRFEDNKGNYLTYHYSNPFGKSLCISEIKFSANSNGITPINSIFFNYKQSRRVENGFIKGIKHEKVAILDNIEVKTSGLLFRKYQITHIEDATLAYQRVSKVQEFNGALEPANPIEFYYDTSQTTINGSEKISNYLNILDPQDISMSGDFDGDGKLDFIANKHVYTKSFEGSTGNLPISLNFDPFRIVTTLKDNKLNQFQSILSYSKTPQFGFTVHNLINNSFVPSFTKTIDINLTKTFLPVLLNSGSTGSIQCANYYQSYGNYTVPNGVELEIQEADFDGNGISEILIKRGPTTYQYEINSFYPQQPYTFNNLDCPLVLKAIDAPTYYLLDLNSNLSTTISTPGFLNLSSAHLSDSPLHRNYYNDFNGDGKTDILQFIGKDYKIIEIIKTNSYATTNLIGSGTIDDYSSTKQILFGDYNGDGKTDIMLPHHDGGGCTECVQWHIYYSNPKPNGGSFFEKETHNIAEYRPDTGSFYGTQRLLNNYYALDINGDGKTDFIKIWRISYKVIPSTNNYNSQWQISAYVNNIGNNNVTGNKFTLEYASPCYNVGLVDDCMHTSDSPELSVPIVSTYKHDGLNKEIIMIKKYQNIVTYVDFTKDFSKDVLLKKVVSSAGNVVDEIFYKPMESSTTNNNQGALNEFYSSSNNSNYPDVEIKKLPTNFIVDKVKNTSIGVTKYQDFRYHGMVVNMNGLGSIGFNKTAKSEWYINGTAKRIWNVTESNPLWRGSPIRTYSQLLTNGNAFEFVTSGDPVGIISSKTNNFFTTTTNGVFRIWLDREIVRDHITGVKNETIYTYDPIYLLPLETETKNYTNTTLEGTAKVTNTFENNPSGLNQDYYIGRPKKQVSLVSAYGDTKESTSEYDYSNNKISQIRKKGNTTNNEYLVEDLEYNTIGNVIKKTISAVGVIATVAPRVTEYTYDTSHRFIKTIKDPELFVTTNVSYHSLYGLVTESKDKFNFSTKTTYDNWGKPTLITNYLGKKLQTFYAKTGSEFVTTKSNDDGSRSEEINDALGKLKKVHTINIDGTWSSKSYEYDYLGRKTKESLPYLGSTPLNWNTTQFDDYGRISSKASATGLTTSITYSGNTVTATDGQKTTTVTKNSNGHQMSSSDNGGTIIYTYYADGNLKTSNFDGTVLEMEYDIYGRKTQLKDPSAGKYNYSYNIYGELLTETTPKGNTTYIYDNFGKILQKRILGLTPAEKTDITSIYSYDADRLLTNMSVTNPFGGNSNYNYQIDPVHKRITKTIESNSFAIFTNQMGYDDFGRVSTETKYAINLADNKSSTKAIKYYYTFGKLNNIYDAQTNKPIWISQNQDAFGNTTDGYFGNGLQQNNTYDQYGLPVIFNTIKYVPVVVPRTSSNQAPVDPNNPLDPNDTIEFDPTPTDTAISLVNLITGFNVQRGNLNYRYSNLFEHNEAFKFDNLDRLVEWGPSTPTEIHNNTFTGSVEGYTTTGTATQNNSLGKLRINSAQPGSGTKKLIATNVKLNTKFNINATINKMTTNKVRAVLLQENITTAAITEINIPLVDTGFNEHYLEFEHTTAIENTNLYIRFDKSPSSTDVGVLKQFTIDNVVVNQTIIEKQVYDNKGRINNNKLGNYAYTNTHPTSGVNIAYQNSSVTLTQEGQDYYIGKPALQVTYNAFKSPITITEGGNKIDFYYNASQGRSTMFYGNDNDDPLQRSIRKHYRWYF